MQHCTAGAHGPVRVELASTTLDRRCFVSSVQSCIVHSISGRHLLVSQFGWLQRHLVWSHGCEMCSYRVLLAVGASICRNAD